MVDENKPGGLPDENAPQWQEPQQEDDMSMPDESEFTEAPPENVVPVEPMMDVFDTTIEDIPTAPESGAAHDIGMREVEPFQWSDQDMIVPLESQGQEAYPGPEQPEPTRHQLRNEELRSRQQSRININRERKSGNKEQADALAQIEARARAGETTVLPDEFSDSAPSPFDWTGMGEAAIPPDSVGDFPQEPAKPRRMPSEQEKRDIEAQALGIAPPSMFQDIANSTGANGQFGGGNQDKIVQLLTEIARTLKSIEGKFSGVATYTE